MDAPDFDLVDTQVGEVARNGVRAWYYSRVDVASLVALPATARELPRVTPEDVPRGASADYVAIDRALERTSRSLPEPFACAAVEHLGFSNPQQLKLTQRQSNAAQCFGRSDRWYRLEQPNPFHGLQPQQYVVKLVTAALLEIRDPRSYVDGLEQATGWFAQGEQRVDAASLEADVRQMHQSAQALYEAGDYEAALVRFRRVALAWQQERGREHLMTMSAVHSTIYCLNRLRRFAEALPLCEHLYAVRVRTLGPDDPSTLDAQAWLAQLARAARSS